MKRIITLIVALVATISMSFAQTTMTYSGKLNISAKMGFIPINVNKDNVEIYYDDNGGTNDVIRIEDMQVEILSANMAVGNITVNNVKNTNGNVTSNGTEQAPNIILTDGSDPTVEWIGGSLPDMVGEVTGTRNDTNETIVLNIPLPVEINGIKVTLTIKYEGKLTAISGIENVVSSNAATTPAYTISGIRANNNTKGIIIKGGKKYVNK